MHRQPCHVIGTSHRPTPLQHWVFPAGGSGLHLVLDEAGHFHTAAFERAMAELDTAEAAKVGSRCSPDMQRLLRTLMVRVRVRVRVSPSPNPKPNLKPNPNPNPNPDAPASGS